MRADVSGEEPRGPGREQIADAKENAPTGRMVGDFFLEGRQASLDVEVVLETHTPPGFLASCLRSPHSARSGASSAILDTGPRSGVPCRDLTGHDDVEGTPADRPGASTCLEGTGAQ